MTYPTGLAGMSASQSRAAVKVPATPFTSMVPPVGTLSGNVPVTVMVLSSVIVPGSGDVIMVTSHAVRASRSTAVSARPSRFMWFP